MKPGNIKYPSDPFYFCTTTEISEELDTEWFIGMNGLIDAFYCGAVFSGTEFRKMKVV